MKNKENLLVSCSFGETSMYLAIWLKEHYSKKYNIKYVFANTGRENEETLIFGQKCSKHFGLDIQWIEAMVCLGARVATGHTKVDFRTASRSGEPYEALISKYGIPNKKFPHCTRELKENPIRHYAKSIGWNKMGEYTTAIGIRADEADRINAKAKKIGIIYPLINLNMTKPKINFWWSQQPFRLNLKGYQGNCKDCWKKSANKLYQIARETPKAFEWSSLMEQKYEYYAPVNRSLDSAPFRFYRGKKTAQQILRESKLPENQKRIIDDSAQIDYQTSIFDESELDLIGGDSCEIFSECYD